MALKKKKLAAIDMGSNSFHLLMAEVSMTGFFPKPRVLTRHKQKVRLADGLNAANTIDDDAAKRACQCLLGFAAELEQFQPDAVTVVATAALRKASNQAQLLEQFENALGHPIQVITGEQEAELIYSGVCSVSQCTDDVLVIDIGGASTEVIAGHGLSPKYLQSLDMGCVVFQNRYFSGGILNDSSFEQAKSDAASLIEPFLNDYRQHSWQRVLGASGTFRAVSEIAHAEGQTQLTREWLTELMKRCAKKGTVEALDFPGLREDRKAVLAGGLAILAGITEALNIEEFEVTYGALREGLLAQLANEVTA
ncbi:Ppx/GppA family phosphatase [Idiomarina sp.]|uniref:Ppx/GppA family phosphatase n=1 Tax=Idiomarina sp. TaxID=1874361 RepID=UPI001DE22EE1|nr:Ppx/GppA family phosphatase [Idiomarina sp.]MCJ8317164.1 Ppx/GppA family phosphatase [Idiomarina sp.]NQZ16779.1 Ppx/GppA family phosphatase [Idiomarina sp.]